jgi:hypothetical protein
VSRLVARAVVVGAVSAFALTQLESEQELVVWELLLLGVVIWSMRGLPGVIGDDAPLFDLSPAEQRRLPRAVSSMELGVIDALSGHLGPERRLQPTLKRIAVHRLQRRGIEFESPAARGAIGEQEWSWLAHPTKEPPAAETIESIVSRLETL